MMMMVMVKIINNKITDHDSTTDANNNKYEQQH